MPESESSSLKTLTDQLGDSQYPHGVCPFMSTIQFVPMRTNLSVDNPIPVPVPGFAPCLGGKCQLWNSTYSECSRKMSASDLKTFANTLFNISGDIDSLRSSVCMYFDNH